MAQSWKRTRAAKDLLEILKENRESLDSGAFLNDIIAEFGGTSALARAIKIEFDNAEPGSAVKQRFLEMVQRLVITNTVHDISKEIDPVEMSDEELKQAAEGLAHKVFGRSTKKRRDYEYGDAEPKVTEEIQDNALNGRDPTPAEDGGGTDSAQN